MSTDASENMENVDAPESDKEECNEHEEPNGILNAADLSQEELNVLKGDVIGNTAYSSKWVLDTLMALYQVDQIGWSDELETNFSMLWDISTEKDVIIFLMKNQFYWIAEHVLSNSMEEKLKEIILGILSNMSTDADAVRMMGYDRALSSRILSQLETDNMDALMQVLRLLQNTMWSISNDSKSPWLRNIKECTFFSDALIYILNNSRDKQILVSLTDLMHVMVDTTFSKEELLIKEVFNMSDLLPALLETFMQVIPERKCFYNETDLKIIDNWMATLSCVMEIKQLTFDDTDNQNSIKISKILLRILQPYQHVHNLIPVSERSAVCIHGCVKIMLWLQSNKLYINPELNCIIACIIHILKSEFVPDFFDMDPDEVAHDLIDYLERYCIRIFDAFTVKQLSEIIQLCKTDVLTSLIEIIAANPDISLATRRKLNRIAQNSRLELT